MVFGRGVAPNVKREANTPTLTLASRNSLYNGRPQHVRYCEKVHSGALDVLLTMCMGL